MKEYLNSRYGKNYLKLYSIENNFVSYILCGELVKYATVGHNGDNIVCIDPPGGPYMYIDDFTHKGMILSKIEFVKNVGFKLIFKL